MSPWSGHTWKFRRRSCHFLFWFLALRAKCNDRLAPHSIIVLVGCLTFLPSVIFFNVQSTHSSLLWILSNYSCEPFLGFLSESSKPLLVFGLKIRFSSNPFLWRSVRFSQDLSLESWVSSWPLLRLSFGFFSSDSQNCSIQSLQKSVIYLKPGISKG